MIRYIKTKKLEKLIKLFFKRIKDKEKLVERARLERQRNDEQRYKLEFSRDPDFIKTNWICRN